MNASMNKKIKNSTLLLAFFVSGVVLASGVSRMNYAKQWPISTQQEGAALVYLTEEVYAHSQSADLKDIAAFNANDEQLVFGPMPALQSTPEEWRTARLFGLNAEKSTSVNQQGAARELSLKVGVNGDVELKTSQGAAAVNSGVYREWVIDTGDSKLQRSAIRFTRLPVTDSISAQFSLESSNDLQQWNSLLGGIQIVQLKQGEQLLSRLSSEIPSSNARYYRLRLENTDLSLPTPSVEFLLRSAARNQLQSSEQSKELQCQADKPSEGFICALPGYVPLEQIDIQMPVNAVSRFEIESRISNKAQWVYLGSLTAFQLKGLGKDLRNEPLYLGEHRAIELRIRPGNPLDTAPKVSVSWHPEPWLLLTRGKPPYVLTAGARDLPNSSFPIETLLAEASAQRDAAWVPASATLGASSDAGGKEVLNRASPEQKKNWVLWGLLGLAALIVVGMVFKLLGESKQTSQPEKTRD